MHTRVDSCKVLGSRIDLIDLEVATQLIDEWVQTLGERPKQVIATGFHGIWEACKDIDFKRMVSEAELWVPDGIAPVWVARLKGHPEAQRVPGPDLMQRFLAVANKRGYRSFFYGDTEETLTKLTLVLQSRYPGHIIAGTYSPPFRPLTPAEDEAIVGRINEAHPHVLWVGLGLPKQERWIYEHRARLRVPVVIGVGAAFGFVSGAVKRCPHWVGECGLEWAYRLAREPRKLWRRDLRDGPRFLFHALLELTGLRKYE